MKFSHGRVGSGAGLLAGGWVGWLGGGGIGLLAGGLVGWFGDGGVGRWLGWLLYLIFLYDYCTVKVSAIKTWTVVILEIQCIACIFINTLCEYDYGLPTNVLKDG